MTATELFEAAVGRAVLARLSEIGDGPLPEPRRIEHNVLADAIRTAQEQMGGSDEPGESTADLVERIVEVFDAQWCPPVYSVTALARTLTTSNSAVETAVRSRPDLFRRTMTRAVFELMAADIGSERLGPRNAVAYRSADPREPSTTRP